MKNSLICVLLALVLLVPLFSGCQRSSSSSSQSSQSSDSQSSQPVQPEYPVEVFGTEIGQQPAKVVSLSPSLTELLCAFGYENRLCGISDYCDFPESVLELERCGSAFHPDWDAISRLQPEYIITATPLQQEDFQQLQQTDTKVIEIAAPTSFEELFSLYHDICVLMDGAVSGENTGTLLAQGYQQQLEALREKVAQEPTAQQYTALLIIDPEVPIVAQGGSIYHEILSVLGLQNLAEDNLPEQPSPDLVLYADTISLQELTDSPIFSQMEAVTQQRTISVPLSAWERCSPRMFDLLDITANQIYTMENLSSGDEP